MPPKNQIEKAIKALASAGVDIGDNEQAMEEHVGTITLKYVEECFEACINHFSNDDENEKMDMATIQPF